MLFDSGNVSKISTIQRELGEGEMEKENEKKNLIKMMKSQRGLAYEKRLEGLNMCKLAKL